MKWCQNEQIITKQALLLALLPDASEHDSRKSDHDDAEDDAEDDEQRAVALMLTATSASALRHLHGGRGGRPAGARCGGAGAGPGVGKFDIEINRVVNTLQIRQTCKN